MVGEVLGGGVGWQQVGLLARHLGERAARLDVVLPDDEAVIPLALDPAADALLQHTEVDDAPYGVEVFCSCGNEGDEVVAVQMTTFALVAEHAMAGGKMDAAGGRHYAGPWSCRSTVA